MACKIQTDTSIFAVDYPISILYSGKVRGLCSITSTSYLSPSGAHAHPFLSSFIFLLSRRAMEFRVCARSAHFQLIHHNVRSSPQIILFFFNIRCIITSRPPRPLLFSFVSSPSIVPPCPLLHTTRLIIFIFDYLWKLNNHYLVTIHYARIGNGMSWCLAKG